jgi:hypothetical protein
MREGRRPKRLLPSHGYRCYFLVRSIPLVELGTPVVEKL